LSNAFKSMLQKFWVKIMEMMNKNKPQGMLNFTQL